MLILRDGLCLLVTNNFPPSIGGAGGVYAALAREAAGRIGILCASRDYRNGGDLPDWRAHDAACGFPVDRIADIRPPLRGGTRLGELLIRARLFARIWALHRRHRFPVLCIADDETVGWLIRPARRLLGCKVILYVHGDDLASRPGAVRLDARRRRQFARADAIVAVSTTGQRDLGARFGVAAGRVSLVPNGIDLSRYKPMPAEPELARSLGLDGKRVIVSIGRLVARKGVDRVIAALPLLRAEFPDLCCLIVGDGPERAALQAQAAAIGGVVFAGAVPGVDIPRYLALAELMVLANRRLADGEDEGFPLVFLEAMACGKPVIAGNAGGVRDEITQDENGLLVDGDDQAAIAAAIGRVLREPGLAARLTEAGLRTARAAAWPVRARAFMELCERLAAR